MRHVDLMEHGDLGTWVDNSVIVILEGFLAQVPPPEKKRALLKRGRVSVWPAPEYWAWSRHAMKVVNDRAHRLSLAIEVVTFLSQDVADMASDWMSKYAIAISDCTYSDFEMFCESLTWRPNVQLVVDADPERLQHYGQRGYQTTWGGEF